MMAMAIHLMMKLDGQTASADFPPASIACDENGIPDASMTARLMRVNLRSARRSVLVKAPAKTAMAMASQMSASPTILFDQLELPEEAGVMLRDGVYVCGTDVELVKQMTPRGVTFGAGLPVLVELFDGFLHERFKVNVSNFCEVLDCAYRQSPRGGGLLLLTIALVYGLLWHGRARWNGCWRLTPSWWWQRIPGSPTCSGPCR